MSRKRVLLLALALLAVVVGVGVVTLLSNLNGLIAAAIEKHGSSATGTRVAVAGVDVSLREGRGEIAGLRIGNPGGYESSDAFQLGKIGIDLDVGSVRSDPIVIDRIDVTAPRIFAEFQRDGGSNLAEIRAQLERFVPAHADRPQPDSDRSKQRRIRIRELVIAEGQIAVDASKLGIDARDLQLPPIRLKDVGGPEGGTPEELTKAILTGLVSRVTSELARSEVERRAKQALEGSTEKVKGLLDQLQR
jgi:uncharacterized protein involved in outer membrane biogenesis